MTTEPTTAASTPSQPVTRAVTLGDTVWAIVDKARNNGSWVAAAIITRVWSASGAGVPATVNLMVLLDAGTPYSVTSATVYPTEAQAQAEMVKRAEAQVTAFLPQVADAINKGNPLPALTLTDPRTGGMIAWRRT